MPPGDFNKKKYIHDQTTGHEMEPKRVSAVVLNVSWFGSLLRVCLVSSCDW